MKSLYPIIFVTLPLLLLISRYNALGQSAQASGDVISIEPHLFGYNANNFNGGPNWNNPQLRHTVTRLHPGNIRYPGGTTSNYWDWRTGGVIETINRGWPKYLSTDVPTTPEVFVRGIPEGTEIVYCINMVRPTPATGIYYSPDTTITSPEVLRSQATLDAKIVDILAGIEAFYRADYPLKYVELGNEFYHGAVGGVDEQGGVYTGQPDLYIDHANQIAEAINERYPNIELAIIGDSDADGKGSEWTQAMYRAIDEGSLKNIDAITFHWYTGPGVVQLNSADSAMKSLSVPFGKARAIRQRDYENAPTGLELWITEYNTWSPPGESNNRKNPGNGGSIQDTWVNGMFGATLGLLYTMMGENISMLNIHTLKAGGNKQWRMLADESSLSGNGVALGAVSEATKGKTSAQELVFSNIPNPTFNNDRPSLYGAKFWNDSKESVIIINSTNQAKNGISIASLFTGSANRQLSQYYDDTPWTQGVAEDGGITYNYIDQLGETLDIPPFSISVIHQAQENLITDASFEQDGTAWSHDNAIQISQKNAVTGRKSLRLASPTQGWQSARQTIAVQDETKYTLYSQVRTQLVAGNARLHIRFYDNNDQEIGTRISSNGLGGEQPYRALRLDFTSPATAVRAEVYLQLAYGTGTVWFDDILLTSTASRENAQADASVVVRAQGTTGEEQLVLIADDVPIGEPITLTKTAAEYRWTVEPSVSNLKVQFANDGRTAQGSDRNIRVDYLILGSDTLQAEDQPINTGSFRAKIGECGGIPSEWLYCAGYIEFASAANARSTQAKNKSQTPRSSAKRSQIYPNPTRGQFSVYSEIPYYRVQVYDAQGKLHLQEDGLHQQIRLDANLLEDGLYLVRVYSAEGQTTHKLMVE